MLRLPGHDEYIPFLRQPCNTAGTVIGVKLNNGELSYSVNGVDMGVAFRGLPCEDDDDDIYPAFELFGQDCEFELL